MKKLLIAAVLILLLGAAFVWSGLYNVAADAPHSKPVYALLETMRERSIAERAKDITPPALDDPALIRAGAGNYDAMCTGCHLAPGMKATELSQGLYPAPPNLAEHGIGDPAQAFWAIKHGIKASGMPAWGKSMDDEYVWGMVAFLRKLPEMTPTQYQAEVDASGGHAHGGGETGGHSHGDEGDDKGGHEHGAMPEAEQEHGESGHDHGEAPEEGHDHGSEDGQEAGNAPREVHTHADGAQHVHAAPPPGTPVAAAQALQAALSKGDASAVRNLLDPQVLIFESGGAERSLEEYAGHHMPSDMAFMKSATYTLQRQTGDSVGDLAWVASEARIAGQASGKPMDVLSTETLVLKKTATGWKVSHIHWSSRPASKR